MTGRLQRKRFRSNYKRDAAIPYEGELNMVTLKQATSWSFVLCGLALTLGSTAFAAPEPQETKDKAKIETAMVELPGGSGPIKGYLARPEGEGPFPAIVLVHEWWGLTDWVKQNADRFAGQGYVALAVDLYGGQVADDPGKAHELMRALDEREAVADLEGGVAYLRKQPYVNTVKKLGVIGWCMGGGYARLLAQASDAVGPTVICYGSVATQPEQLATLKDNRILGIFGAKDQGIPASRVETFRDELKKLGGQVEVHIYDDAGHAFMRRAEINMPPTPRRMRGNRSPDSLPKR